MRVMLTSVPAVGHFFPLVPLAHAFRAAGHEVLIVLAEHPEWAVNAGLPVVDPAPGYDAVGIAMGTLENDPAFRAEWFQDIGPDRDISPRAPMFAAFNASLVAGTLEVAEQWRPHLIVHEQTTSVGAMAAAKLGVPAVQRNIGPVVTNDTHQRTARLLGDLCDKHGITGVPATAAIVELLPPSMLTAPGEGWHMGGSPYNGGGLLGHRLPQRPGRPLIALSMGGGFSARFFGLGAMHPLLAAAAEADADFVLALGNADINSLGPLPPNVRPSGWVPFGELFRTCAGVVHHGGGSTALAAIDAGVPQLVALDPADKGSGPLAHSVRQRGVGLTAAPDEVTTELLEQLIGDENLRTATAEVRTEIAGLPAPAAIVQRLADLVARL
jgi:hypothetical protein